MDSRALGDVFAGIVIGAVALGFVGGIALWELFWWLAEHTSFSWN